MTRWRVLMSRSEIVSEVEGADTGEKTDAAEDHGGTVGGVELLNPGGSRTGGEGLTVDVRVRHCSLGLGGGRGKRGGLEGINTRSDIKIQNIRV